jgi:hypothetical protein
VSEILGGQITVDDEQWTLWSNAPEHGAKWAFQRGVKTTWIKVRKVTSGGKTYWIQAKENDQRS